MTDADRAQLLALEMLRRQVGGLVMEFARVYQQAQIEEAADEAARQAPAAETPRDPGDDVPPRRPDEKRSDAKPAPVPARAGPVKIDGLDPALDARAAQLTAQSWPKVLQLVNEILQNIVQLNAPAGQTVAAKPATASATPRQPDPLSPEAEAARGRQLLKTLGRQEQRPYLDAARTRILALRRAVGNTTGNAMKRATAAAGRVRGGLANTRAGRFLNRELGGKGGRAARRLAGKAAGGAAGAAKGAAAPLTSALTAAFSPFALKLLAVLGPMALLAATLSSATSGFQLVTSATRLLAATLGPVLMPFMFLLAAGLATLSDLIWAEIAPSLEGWYSLIINEAVPAAEELINKFKSLTDAIKWVIDIARNPEKALSSADGSGGEGADGRTGIERTFDSVQSLIDPLGVNRSLVGGALGMFGLEAPRSFAEQRAESSATLAANARPIITQEQAAAGRTAAQAMEENAPKKEPSGRDLFAKNMQDTLRELQMSVGPKASFQGITQASKSAQLAALNQSPFEARMLTMMQDTLGKLTRVVDNTTRQPDQRFDDKSGRKD